LRVDLPELLPLLCLACRTQSERGHEVFTVELVDILRRDGDEVLEGVLRCVHCRRAYPIVDGIPILVADAAGFWARDVTGLVDPDLAPEVAALFALAGPDDAALARLLELASIYLDAHWGDHATPAPTSPGRGGAALWEKLRGHARVDSAIELGCGMERGLAELSRSADLTVGIDVSLGSLRRARRVLGGAPLRYARRVAGRHYVPAQIAAPAVRVELICADAQDPPLPPERFARVAALNILDVVHNPDTLLTVATGLTRPGGELLLASPYAWQSGFVGEEHRIGDLDPAAAVVAWLRAAGFTVEEETDLEWSLRRDARSSVAYAAHWLRARKPSTTC
jgi:uncharacterized protein YbaR (Trm112 family)/SAM-dependent methyltransferase